MISIVTRAGAKKSHSEDAVLCGSRIVVNDACLLPIPSNSFVAVADGVGGCRAGEVASSFVLKALSACAPNDLYNQLIAINNRLLSEGKLQANRQGMATTLTGIYYSNDESILIHIGNTRAYSLQGKYLKQLTSDHTVYNWLKSSGRIEEAENCNQNEITNCFGGGDSKLIERLYVAPLPMTQTLLLTSDGIHEHISIDDLEETLLMDTDDLEKCEILLQKALAAGSTDDLTVVIINDDLKGCD